MRIRAVAGLVFLLTGLVGLWLAGVVISGHRTAIVSQTWPAIDAVVLEGGDTGLMHLRSGQYVYNIGGENHSQTRLRLLVQVSPFFGRVGSELGPGYYAGQKIKVRVDPESPARSVVANGPFAEGLWGWLAIAGLLVFTGFGSLAAVFRGGSYIKMRG